MHTPIVDALSHYEQLIEEGKDPFHDSSVMQEYMARWDGPLFFSALGDMTGKNVLEIGLGTGRIARRVLDLGCGHLTGIDISPKTVEQARSNLSDYQNVELMVADCTSFVCEEAFDVAYSVLTFMHISEKRKALGNIVASLRLGGRLILSVDECGEWFDYGTRKIRLYPAPPADYVKWLQESGCDVEPPIDLVDRFTLPDGRKFETYGKRIASLIRATKV